MNPKARIIVIICAFLGLASVSYAAGEVTGTRDLPDSYLPSQTITVSLDLEVDETRTPNGVIVKDYVPAGWSVTSATPSFNNFDSTSNSFCAIVFTIKASSSMSLLHM